MDPNDLATARRARRWLLGATGFFILVNLAIAIVFGLFGTSRGPEEFLRLTNLGKSHAEKGDATNALAVLEQALQLAPANLDAQLNVASADLLANRTTAALQRAEQVLAFDRNSAAAHFIRGCAFLRSGQPTNAIQELQTAKNMDVTVNAVTFQLGLAYEAAGLPSEAIGEWTELAQFDPDHPAVHYRLGQLLLRTGKKDEGLAELELHRQAIAKNPPGVANPATYERCKYTAIRLPSETEPPDKSGVPVAFAEATARAFPAGAPWQAPLGVVDFAQTGQNHLFVTGRDHSFRLLSNSNGVFTATGQPLPARPEARYQRCLVGDFNNDGVPDVLVLGEQGVHLFKFTTNGTPTETTTFAGLKNATGREGALLDLDFRGNLDVLTVQPNGQGLRALRNLGNMYFSDVTTNSGLPTPLPGVRAVVVEDWNGDDLLDVLIAREGQPPLLCLKQRGGPLIPTNTPPDWPAGQVIAVGDLNNDLHPDLVIATSNHLEVVLNGLKVHLTIPLTGFKPERLCLWDYDNDGWLDILATGDGLRLFRNLGQAGFRDVTARVGLDKLARGPVTDFALADFDRDGDTDLVVATSGGLQFLRNDGGNANLQLKLLLAGRRSNASGFGVRLEAAAGGLRLCRRVGLLPVEIGVGRHAQLDSLSARWFNLAPSLIEVKVEPRTPLQLIELSIQEGSCPYLYAWDGARFRFVTDILGASPLGLPLAQGRLIEADSEEIVWLGNEANFKALENHYTLQITEELREVLYLDEAKLLVADHPAGTEMHGTSKLRPGRPFPQHELVLLNQRHPLLLATRETGVEVTTLLAENDGQVVSPLRLRPSHLRGLAEPHSLTLDFGPLAPGRPFVLALTGWLRLGGGMANIAASHHPDLPFPFPTLEAETTPDHWQPVAVTVGAPSGKTKTILVDLEGRLPAGARRLRLNLASEIHWDRAALFERADPSVARVTQSTPASAHLHWRGFSALANLPSSSPWTPVYEQVKSTSLFTLAPGGWCTRYGAVDELVAHRDNALVLLNAGDELTLSFPAAPLPPLPPGFSRDFFLLTSGWDKDSDFHVVTGTTVEPLPWHGLDDQLYGRQPRPPFTNDAWISKYNTRWCGPELLTRRP